MNYPFINHKILILTCTGLPLRRTWPPAVSYLHRGVLPLMKYANDSYMGRQVNPVIDRTPEITSLSPLFLP